MIHFIREGRIVAEHIRVFGFFHNMYRVGLDVKTDDRVNADEVRGQCPRNHA